MNFEPSPEQRNFFSCPGHSAVVITSAVNPDKLNGNDLNEGSLYVFISVELLHPHQATILRDQFRRILKVRYG